MAVSSYPSLRRLLPRMRGGYVAVTSDPLPRRLANHLLPLRLHTQSDAAVEALGAAPAPARRGQQGAGKSVTVKSAAGKSAAQGNVVSKVKVVSKGKVVVSKSKAMTAAGEGNRIAT